MWKHPASNLRRPRLTIAQSQKHFRNNPVRTDTVSTPLPLRTHCLGCFHGQFGRAGRNKSSEDVFAGGDAKAMSEQAACSESALGTCAAFRAWTPHVLETILNLGTKPQESKSQSELSTFRFVVNVCC